MIGSKIRVLASERLLAKLKLFLQVRQRLPEKFVPDTTVDDAWCLVGSEHNLLPRLVDLVEALGFLRQLLGNVSADEDSL